MKYLIRVELSWACFGFIVEDGIITKSAPISAWAIRKKGKDIVMYWKKRGAAITWEEIE